TCSTARTLPASASISTAPPPSLSSHTRARTARSRRPSRTSSASAPRRSDPRRAFRSAAPNHRRDTEGAEEAQRDKSIGNWKLKNENRKLEAAAPSEQFSVSNFP